MDEDYDVIRSTRMFLELQEQINQLKQDLFYQKQKRIELLTILLLKTIIDLIALLYFVKYGTLF